MHYSMNFGKLSAKPKASDAGSAFALFVLGDFSGRANRGELETGAALAARKPRRVDVDNLDDVLESMELKLNLPIGDAGGAAEVSLASIDDFHPDELYENVELFEELAGLRSRMAGGSFASAAAEAQAWLADAPADGQRFREKPRGVAIPNAKLSDFATLMGKPTAADAEATPAGELIQQVVRPHIQPAADPAQDQMIASVDAALSSTMRRLLHHPDFQTIESLWRSVDLLTRELETGPNLQIILYDISAEEIAADLGSSENLEETGLYQLLVEKPETDSLTTAPAVIVGAYQFEQTPPHADLLGRVGQIAAAAGAPFVSSIGLDALTKKKPEEIPPAVAESWDALRSLPHAAYVGLAAPRFLLRWPYGAKTEPIDPFDFEEFTPQFGLKGFLWGNAAVLAGLMLGKTFQEQGMAGMKLGSVMVQGDLPVYYYTDKDGDQIALPCTERVVTEANAQHVTGEGFIPVLWMKGRPEVRLGGLGSLAGAPLAGPWGAVDVSGAEVPAPAAAVAGEAEPAEPVSSGDDELDALLAGIEDEPGDASADADGDDSSGDEELDALLASLDDEPAPDNDDGGDDDEVDDELAALLADL